MPRVTFSFGDPVLWIPQDKRRGTNPDAKGILVVEDNHLNQRMMLLMLKHVGLNCDLANNGLESLEALNRRSYRLVFMDIDMPILNGLDAARRIRSDKTLEQPSIIAVTASTVSERTCREAGMDGILTKPLRVQRLKELLSHLDFLPESNSHNETSRTDPCRYAL